MKSSTLEIPNNTTPLHKLEPNDIETFSNIKTIVKEDDIVSVHDIHYRSKSYKFKFVENWLFNMISESHLAGGHVFELHYMFIFSI